MTKKKLSTNEALEQITSLFSQASAAFPGKKAHLYVKKARKIAMKKRMALPKKFKRRFCKFCYSYLKHGNNARVRINNGKVIIYCEECKKYTRIHLK